MVLNVPMLCIAWGHHSDAIYYYIHLFMLTMAEYLGLFLTARSYYKQLHEILIGFLIDFAFLMDIF